MKSLPPVRSRANERAPPTGPTHPVQDQRSINSGVRPGQQYPAPSCTSDADAIFTVNSRIRTMTTPDSALNALAHAVGAADSPLAANLAEILTDAIQELIEVELTARIGAEPGERTLTRTNLRNGHRPKTLSTPGGDLEVKIPKLRKGSFFPELLEPRRRIDKALWAVIMTAYISGTSTRKVDDLVKALGCDTGISKSSVSRICKHIDADVAVLRNRDLGHQAFVYLWLDATYVHVREAGQVVSKAVVIATGLRADGDR